MIEAAEYCSRVFDGTHDTPKPSDEGHPLLTSKNIKDGSLDYSGSYLISDTDYQSVQKRSYVSQWDVLFSMIGTVGDVYLEKSPEIPYAVKNVGVFSCLDRKRALWLYYYLQSPAAKKHIERHQSGAVQKFLSLGALRSFPIPEFSEKRSSGIELLATLDAKIALNNRINAELEAMAKLLYDYWFVQFDFPMTAAQAAALGQAQLEGQPYKSSGGKMVFNPILKREIPEGWEVGNLGSIASMTRGVTYNKDDVRNIRDSNVTPVLRATNVTDRTIDIDNMVYLPADLVSEKQLMRKDDILIVMSSGSKNHIGKNAAYYFEDKVGFGAFCSKITPKASHKCFVKTCMQSDHFKGHIQNVCLGTNINNLTTGHISEFRAVIPQQEILGKFEQALTSSCEMIATNQKQNQELTTLRDWLLPMLMNGQVTVK